MDGPWDRWDDIAALHPSDVPDKKRPMYAVGWLRTEINSGGFEALFFNLAGDVVPDAVVASRQAGISELSELLETAMALLGDMYPIDIDERQRIVMAFTDENRNRLLALDAQYYDLEATVDLDQVMTELDPGT